MNERSGMQHGIILSYREQIKQDVPTDTGVRGFTRDKSAIAPADADLIAFGRYYSDLRERFRRGLPLSAYDSFCGGNAPGWPACSQL
jgi:hypothetical protein